MDANTIRDAMEALSNELGKRDSQGELCFLGAYDPQFQHLRIVAPIPEYLLAMKCMASRIGSLGEADDKADIRFCSITLSSHPPTPRSRS